MSARGAGAIAIVPAGGMGVRVGGRMPKQYLALGGVPLLVHTLRVLARARALRGTIVAVPEDRVERTRALLVRHRVARVLAVVAGGTERQGSVWNALQASPPDAGWIVVHDAVRPFLSPGLVDAVLAAAREHGAATCGVAVRETVKRLDGDMSGGSGMGVKKGARVEGGRSVGKETRVVEGLVRETLDRTGLWLVQTPQAFRRALLWEGHDKARRDGFRGTDDAVLVERLGTPVAMVAGSPTNLKVTTRDDLRIARLWMRA
jgi:2-C-methyl-D-erythritol 4-phosphate cytidylyltransferase